MKKSIFILVLLLNVYLLSAQQVEYARELLKSLCSPEFDGRGYYKHGDSRAADYLEEQFTKIGLKKFDDSYFQKYSFSANSINGNLELVINGKKLLPGVDYLVDPSSPSIDRDIAPFYLTAKMIFDSTNYKDLIPKFEDKFVVIDKTLMDSLTATEKKYVKDFTNYLINGKRIENYGVIELTNDNLVYSASQYQDLKPLITVKKKSIDGEIKNGAIEIESDYYKNYKTKNLIGFIEGDVKDTFICLSAHYDHLGRMGKDIYFPGANDNASGTSLVLNLAKKLANNKSKYSIAIILFSGEEIGLMGSKYFSENPLFPLSNIKFLLNLDLSGTGDDGITVVNGSIFKDKFDKLVEINSKNNYLKEIRTRDEACNSDHCHFYKKGVPCFFFYTMGGISEYHNIFDKAETLPLTKYNELYHLILDFLNEIK